MILPVLLASQALSRLGVFFGSAPIIDSFADEYGRERNHAGEYFGFGREVANTISGNARKTFGREFMISVPVMVEGAIQKMHTPRHTRCYVIPVYWKSYAASVVVCLEK